MNKPPKGKKVVRQKPISGWTIVLKSGRDAFYEVFSTKSMARTRLREICYGPNPREMGEIMDGHEIAPCTITFKRPLNTKK